MVLPMKTNRFSRILDVTRPQSQIGHSSSAPMNPERFYFLYLKRFTFRRSPPKPCISAVPEINLFYSNKLLLPKGEGFRNKKLSRF
jgi:hypothetical protein